MIKLSKGSTRFTILYNNYAIKIPALYSWHSFIKGMLVNEGEYLFSQVNSIKPVLCPILYSNQFGLVNVMRRCDILNDEKSLNEFFNSVSQLEEIDQGIINNIVESKLDSVGLLDGKIVAVDYGIITGHQISDTYQKVELLINKLKGKINGY